MEFTYLIAMGSNLGDRRAAIKRATGDLGARAGQILAVSKLYETEPIGNATLVFINAACLLRSSFEPLQLMTMLLAIEAEMGRVRDVHWGDRLIDLDIIMARDEHEQTIILQSDTLTLPHPRCLERGFVIVPAADVCPDWVFPGQKHTFAELAKAHSKMA